ncbi:hypothetical protein RD01_05965 [Pectobacterium carotovorum subsp. carotovorum]|nr:hypothetical protein RD01_05965 [Pectobacterium carotovorum subsp. carotovorum]
MTQENHDQRSRLPRGIASKNPTPMRLSDDERDKLAALAAQESRSLSSMARLVFLRGLESFNVQG